ncbi:hypothetical protein HMPREF9997_02810 [Corynebacterium durum F0235]|uniref:Uncharacterized protein n=1 Tax=Corynebacterium durum F0235 TaxID=1035195 RepID=L1M918_9CORY|nr:hypothetical protein HMPREF9997_02810 [Corynebacterium durum F0235]
MSSSTAENALDIQSSLAPYTEFMCLNNENGVIPPRSTPVNPHTSEN